MKAISYRAVTFLSLFQNSYSERLTVKGRRTLSPSSHHEMTCSACAAVRPPHTNRLSDVGKHGILVTFATIDPGGSYRRWLHLQLFCELDISRVTISGDVRKGKAVHVCHVGCSTLRGATLVGILAAYTGNALRRSAGADRAVVLTASRRLDVCLLRLSVIKRSRPTKFSFPAQRTCKYVQFLCNTSVPFVVDIQH